MQFFFLYKSTYSVERCVINKKGSLPVDQVHGIAVSTLPLLLRHYLGHQLHALTEKTHEIIRVKFSNLQVNLSYKS